MPRDWQDSYFDQSRRDFWDHVDDPESVAPPRFDYTCSDSDRAVRPSFTYGIDPAIGSARAKSMARADFEQSLSSVISSKTLHQLTDRGGTMATYDALSFQRAKLEESDALKSNWYGSRRGFRLRTSRSAVMSDK